MPIQAQSADGVTHEFPDGTDDSVIDKTMKDYAKQKTLTSGGKVTGEAPVKMGMGGQFVTGLEDVALGDKQLTAHLEKKMGIKSPEDVQKIDLSMKKRESDIAAAGGRGAAGFAGNALGAGVYGAALAPVLGTGLAAGIGGGMLAGAMQPTTGGLGTFYDQKADDILWGGVLGGAGHTAMKILGAALGPTLDKAQQMLHDSGVQLTPGQVFPWIKNFEESLKSVPILANFIAGAEGRAISGFNRAVYNQTLEPLKSVPGIQVTVPNNLTGRPLFQFVKSQFDNAYSTVLQGMQVKPDYDLGMDLSAVKNLATRELTPEGQKAFDRNVTDKIAQVVRGTTDVKTAVRDMQVLADQARRSPLLSDQRAAQLYEDVKASLSRAVSRQNPAKADQLRKVDEGYAAFARARDAALRRRSSNGEFTPGDLLSAIKGQEKRQGAAGLNRVASGNALLQLYAENADNVLKNTVPESGTPKRLLHLAAAKWALEHKTGAAAALALSAPYTKTGSAIFDAYIDVARGGKLGSVVRKAAPAGGAGLSYGYERQDKEEPAPYGGPQQ